MRPHVLPVEDYFRNPKETTYQLSPDGRMLAWLQPWNDRLNIHVRAWDGDTATRLTSSERDIFSFRWANNHRLVWVQDNAGDEIHHLLAIDADGDNELDLTPFEGVNISIVDELRDNDDELLIGMNQRNPQVFDVYRVNVSTGEMRMTAQNPGQVARWITDHEGKLRAAVTTDGVFHGLLYRETEDEPFRELVRHDFRQTITPLLFTPDNHRLYVLSNVGRNTSAVYEFDPVSRRTTRLLFEHPDVDADRLEYSHHRQKLTAVVYITEREHRHFFDDTCEQIHAMLAERLPRRDLRVVSRSRDERRLLVRTSSDLSLGGYYWFDLDADTHGKLGDVAPWIDRNTMAPMQPITYTARDGLTIHGYLTLPVGEEPKSLPLIALPHGGPWMRDTWGFHSIAQFLANRGYAVLQMNFRGSSGYGRAFWEAGFKQWGRAMQDDITDGVRHFIEQGVADPARIGIMGVSYGGYAALCGLAFTPDLFACGVDIVGVSDIETLLKGIPPYWEHIRAMFYTMIGDPGAEAEKLREVSPLHHANAIHRPVLIAQGANDPRVKKHTTDAMVEQLRVNGVEVEYIVKKNEGHGFTNQENRIEFYHTLERFLAAHLGGRTYDPSA